MKAALYNGRNDLVLFTAAVAFFHRIHVPQVPVTPEVSVSCATLESSDFFFFFILPLLRFSGMHAFMSSCSAAALGCVTSYHGARCFACQHEWNAYFGVLARLQVRCLPLPHLHVPCIMSRHTTICPTCR
jgi:hypothetical protein